MTLNRKPQAKAQGGILQVESPNPEAAAQHRFMLHAPRFTLQLSCLTLPALLLLSGGPADSLAAATTPYQPIVERNVFGLKPPPPPPPPESLKPPPPKLTLTGIMTIFGKKQALLKAPPTPAAPARPGQQPEPPKEHSYILAEGQREDGITVLQIDDKAKTVKLDIEGTIADLTFSTNETHTASTSPAPGRIPSPTGFGGGTPGLMPPRVIPGRPLRIPSMGSSSATTIGGGNSGLASAGNTGAPVGAMGYGGYGGVPAGGVNVGGNTLNFGGERTSPQFIDAAASHDPGLANMSGEAQAALLEVQRQATANEVQSGKLGPLPVTQYTPAGSLGTLPEDNTAENPGGGNVSPIRSRMLNRPGMPQLPQ